jgi:hypothetical protein
MRLTRKAFVDWLRRRKNSNLTTQNVGNRRVPNKCPLATFYKDAVGARYVEAASEIEWTRDGKRWYRLQAPKWAIEFMDKVDDTDMGAYNSLVTADEALGHLGES